MSELTKLRIKGACVLLGGGVLIALAIPWPFNLPFNTVWGVYWGFHFGRKDGELS